MPMPKILPHARGGFYMNATFDGKRGSIYGRDEAEVEKKYIKKCYEHGLGIKVGQRVLLKDYLRTFLSLRKPDIKPYTYEGYKNNIENHIIPALGDMYLQQLMPADIKSFYAKKRKERETAPAEKDKLQAAQAAQNEARTQEQKTAATALLNQVNARLAKTHPLGETALLYIHRVLHAALSEAVDNQLIASNPADRIKPPKPTPVRHSLPEEGGVRLLFASVIGQEYELAVHLAVAGGLRRGEICAGEWDQLDWVDNKFLVDKAIVQTKETGRMVDLPKKEKIREVFLPPSLMDRLRIEKAKQETEAEFFGEAYQKNNLIVKHRDGSPYTPTSLSSAINDAIKRAGLKTTLHGLRSTYVSMGYKLGADEKAITDSAGHHSVEFNRLKYQSVYDSMKEDLAGKMDEALYGAES